MKISVSTPPSLPAAGHLLIEFCWCCLPMPAQQSFSVGDIFRNLGGHTRIVYSNACYQHTERAPNTSLRIHKHPCACHNLSSRSKQRSVDDEEPLLQIRVSLLQRFHKSRPQLADDQNDVTTVRAICTSLQLGPVYGLHQVDALLHHVHHFHFVPCGALARSSLMNLSSGSPLYALLQNLC